MSDCLRKMQMAETFDEAVKNDEINNAKLELEKYLEANPHMRAYNDEIINILELYPRELRMKAIEILIAIKTQELQRALLDLSDIL